ncbi:class I SAM-dependent methyltransferase [Metallosphaera tengchongensis]|uniref:Class I SAM-dependent methyltransferase n=1 Tax=Metallosphaera tengchongensis TaxID=1532350 RepID=A0A6N0NSQ5_9CREN|nr:class I SAM-dependent methyltransferase [Metallosphaera tengchongensis]QKQ99136.1 class I SAM-dependent methyltransferase [Metallosphaera tengchongensis]
MKRHSHFDRLLDERRKNFENPENFIPKLLRGDEIVVDMGCGPGYYCPELEKYSSKLYCVDFNKEALDIAKTRIKKPNTELLYEESSRTSIPPSSVDVVVLANSFHDMDREAAYSEILRILKPSGKVIIVDWKKEETPFGPPMSIRMSEKDYINLFKDFELKQTFDPGPYHYGLVLIRKSN